MTKPSVIALIPARSGSKRVADKNIRPLGGHPMIAYSIAAAKASGVFDAVVVSTDSEHYAQIARHYGAEVPFMRPAEYAGAQSPDIEWVEFTLGELAKQGRVFDCFSILRPTSPFRSANTIRRAFAAFQADPEADSLRAVEKCSQHPGKMWVLQGGRMEPLMPKTLNGVPWHSCQMAALPEIYVQNASLEIAWTRVALEQRTIAGKMLIPFISDGLEGFDINQPEDWWLAEHLLANQQAALPPVEASAFAVAKTAAV